MLTLILCFLGVWFIMYILAISIYHPKDSLIWGFTFGLGSFGALLVWLITANTLENKITETSYIYKEAPIASLRNDNQLHGEFFLGCGTISEYEYYFFFKENKNGRLEREKISVNCVEIEETDLKSPCLAVPYKVRYLNKSKMKNYRLWFINKENEEKVNDYHDFHQKRILYVPKGTIITNFKLY